MREGGSFRNSCRCSNTHKPSTWKLVSVEQKIDYTHYEMFKKAFMPATKVIPLVGIAVTIGSPPWIPVTGS